MTKRYVLLFSVTAILVAALLLSKPYFQQPLTEVTLYEVQKVTSSQTVTCTGRVQAADSTEVYVQVPCIASKVNVKAGDTVNKGDVLFTVNVAATKQVLAAAGGISQSLISEDQIQKEVTAPEQGTISSLNVVDGGTVKSDTACAVITRNDILQVSAAISESYIKNVAIGQSVMVSGTAFAKDGYQGTVTYISPSARQQYIGTSSETVVDAIITLSERDSSLKPGLTAKAKIEIGSSEENIILPYEYVLQDESNNEYVYLYDDATANKCIVKTGKEYAGGFEILSGLSVGDQVIKNPDDISKNNQKVRIRADEAVGGVD